MLTFSPTIGKVVSNMPVFPVVYVTTESYYQPAGAQVVVTPPFFVDDGSTDARGLLLQISILPTSS